MRSFRYILTSGLLAVAAKAEWPDVKPGMDQAAVLQCVGMPLLQNRGRGGAEVWTYDRRGYVQFQGGRVSYCEPSKAAPRPAPVATKPAMSQVKKPAPLAKGVVALRD